MIIKKTEFSATPTQDANKTNSEYKKNNNNYYGCNSFSGSDMVAIMTIPGLSGSKGIYVLGSLQTLSISTSMQRSPIRSIGNINAKDYVMGPRTIAGSLVFAVFDKHFAYEAMQDIQGEIGTYNFLADELPPFDITVTMANEYGKMSRLVIYGVRLVNEGQVMSINDIYIENTYQFVAKDYDYLTDQTDSVNDIAAIGSIKPTDEITIDTINSEDIEPIKDDKPEDKNIDINKIKVIAKTKDALVNDGINEKGSVELTLNIKQQNGFIELFDDKDISLYKFDLQSVALPIIHYLNKGQYYAKYVRNNEYSIKCNFTIGEAVIDSTLPNKPIILCKEIVNNLFYVDLKASDNISKGICYVKKAFKDNVSNYEFVTFEDKKCRIKLELNNEYIIKAYNGNKYSEDIELYTDKNLQNIFDDFKSYIENNKTKIPTDYYSYFNTLWNNLISIVKLSNSNYIVSTALYKAKQTQTDYNIRKIYDYYLKEAIDYENNFTKYNNKINVVEAPIIINYTLSIIELNYNIDHITIFNGEKYPKTIMNTDFKKDGDKYTYQLKCAAGLYTIIAYDIFERESAPINIMVYDSSVKSEMLSKENMENATKQENVELIAIRNNCFDKIIKGDTNYLIYNQLLFNTNKLYNCVAEPIIKINNEDKLVINVDYINKESYYLCLDEAIDLKFGSLVFREKLNRNIKTYTFYKDKYGLIKDTRYCLWIEDSSGEIISDITSFSFANITSDITQQINSLLLNRIKNYYSETDNKSFILSYNEDIKEISPIEIFDECILNNFNLKNNNVIRKDLLLDAIDAKCKFYNNRLVNIIANIVINKHDSQIDINITNAIYNTVNISIIRNDNINHYVFDLNDSVTLESGINGLIIQFVNEKDVTKPIVIDIATKDILRNAGASLEVNL